MKRKLFSSVVSTNDSGVDILLLQDWDFSIKTKAERENGREQEFS